MLSEEDELRSMSLSEEDELRSMSNVVKDSMSSSEDNELRSMSNTVKKLIMNVTQILRSFRIFLGCLE